MTDDNDDPNKPPSDPLDPSKPEDSESSADDGLVGDYSNAPAAKAPSFDVRESILENIRNPKDDDDGPTLEELEQMRKEALKKKIQLWASIAGGAVFIILIIIVSCQQAKGTIRYGMCKVFLELTLDYPLTLKVSEVREQGGYVRIHFTHLDSFGQFRSSRMECNFKMEVSGAAREWIRNILKQAQYGPEGELLQQPSITIDAWANAAGVNLPILLAFLKEEVNELATPEDLGKLAAAVGQPPPQGQLALDKVIHNLLPVSQDRINHFNKTIPVLLENPPDLTLPGAFPSNLADLYIE